MSKYKSDFVIITAIPVEFDEFKKAITRLGGEIQEIKGGSGIYQGKISSAEKSFLFYASCQLFPGMVSAATLATKMIEHHQPRYIVMLGIAAGFRDESMVPGSVLIADFVANYQQGKRTKKGFQRDVTTLPLDPTLRGLLSRSKDQIIDQLNTEMAPPPRKLRAYIGPIVTGNEVVASQDIMDGLKNSFRKVVGVEMEGFAIFQAAAEASAPKPSAILIKSVCDFGDDDKDDDYHQLAAHTSAQFFLRFALKHLEPAKLSDKPLNVRVIPWKYMKEREEKRLAKLLDKCNAGNVVKFISITGKSFLAPEVGSSKTPDRRDHFEEALKRGVTFYGVLLDPKSVEARFRTEIESPQLSRNSRLLIRDAASVAAKLKGAPDAWRKNLKICYTKVGLAFKLWLFEDEAYIEPYHFGKQNQDRGKESPLCGFSHLWIEKSAPEFELLRDHFDKLWGKCNGYGPDVLEGTLPSYSTIDPKPNGIIR